MQTKKNSRIKKTKESSNNKIPFKAFLIIVLCTVFTALGQLFWKLSAKTFGISIAGTILNYYLILGFLSYGLGAILLIFALRKADLSVIYPFVSLSFIWVALLSILFLHESISIIHWAGMIAIIIGVALIARGAR